MHKLFLSRHFKTPVGQLSAQAEADADADADVVVVVVFVAD